MEVQRTKGQRIVRKAMGKEGFLRHVIGEGAQVPPAVLFTLVTAAVIPGGIIIDGLAVAIGYGLLSGYANR
jgi:hypothetical protein